MNQANEINTKSEGNPQALRKAEIARLLKSVNNAPFNSEKGSNNKSRSFEKRSLLDIALSSNQDENNDIDGTVDSRNSVPLSTDDSSQKPDVVTPEDNSLEVNETIDYSDTSLNTEVEEGPSIEERIKIAEETAFEKGRQQGLVEGHTNGLSEARAQAQEGLDAAIATLRSASDAINNSNDNILDLLHQSIEHAILGIAKECSGFIIDKIPEEFMERVSSLSKVINKNISEITLDMNEQDFEAIKTHIVKDEVLSSLKIRVINTLNRGDMVLSSEGMKISDVFLASKIEPPKNFIINKEELSDNTLPTHDFKSKIQSEDKNNQEFKTDGTDQKKSETSNSELNLAKEQSTETENRPLKAENKEEIKPEEFQNTTLEKNNEIVNEPTIPNEEGG